MNDRRNFLRKTGLAVCGAAGALIGRASAAEKPGDKETHTASKVPPTEKLMYQHGLVQRVVMTYEEVAKRLEQKEQLPPTALNSGPLVDEFIEQYHEELEEKYVFPVFLEAEQQKELIKTLRTQHRTGRRLSQRIYYLAGKENISEDPTRTDLARALRRYARMYRAHAAYEDTILLPALRDVATSAQIGKMGKQFVETTQKDFAEGGLASVLGRLQPIEKSLEINQLSVFTASVGT
ncbi:MAG: hemerythrin domain-containing protein [Planctomycetes bacterium]|nr:hemerythrin domain-containing protein [Planctomycetota bacterium]